MTYRFIKEWEGIPVGIEIQEMIKVTSTGEENTGIMYALIGAAMPMFTNRELRLLLEAGYIKEIPEEKTCTTCNGTGKVTEETNPYILTVTYTTFNTLQETFEYYWNKIKEMQENTWRWNEVKTDPDHLRLWNATFEPNTTKVVRINMKANQGKSTKEVRKEQTYLPGVEILAAVAQHPEYAKKMDGEEYPYVNLGGLELNYGRPTWGGVPYLDFVGGGRRVRLGSDGCVGACPLWSVPLQEECRKELNEK